MPSATDAGMRVPADGDTDAAQDVGNDGVRVGLGLVGFAVSMLLLGAAIQLGLRGDLPVLVVFGLLIGSRCVFALFGSGTPPASQAYVADRTSREERMDEIATLTSGFTLGQMAGPAAAAVLITGGAILSSTVGLFASAILLALALLGTIFFWVIRKGRHQLLTEEESPPAPGL